MVTPLHDQGSAKNGSSPPRHQDAGDIRLRPHVFLSEDRNGGYGEAGVALWHIALARGHLLFLQAALDLNPSDSGCGVNPLAVCYRDFTSQGARLAVP